MKNFRLYQGDAGAILPTMPAESVQLVCTSPPYFNLRHYLPGAHPDCHLELGRERTPEEYVERLIAVFREIKRVLRVDGCVFLNLGDCYWGSWQNYGGQNRGNGKQRAISAGSMPRPVWSGKEQERPVVTKKHPILRRKNLIGIPFRIAFALQEDGWYLRSVIPWIKRNALCESVRDRPTTANEYLLMLTKSEKYYWDRDAIRKTHGRDWGAENRQIGTRKYRVTSGPMFRRGTGQYDKDWSKDYVAKQHPAGRNRRTSDWWFESLDLLIEEQRSFLEHLEAAREKGILLAEDGAPLALNVSTAAYRGAHFAVFPPQLIEPIILAGSSLQACEHCLAPWARVVEKPLWGMKDSRSAFPEGSSAKRLSLSRQYYRSMGLEGPPARATLSWRPTCACPNSAGAGRSIVLDPFAGSGTTLAVALKHGRGAIGIELSGSYIDLARQRIANTCK